MTESRGGVHRARRPGSLSLRKIPYAETRRIPGFFNFPAKNSLTLPFYV